MSVYRMSLARFNTPTYDSGGVWILETKVQCPRKCTSSFSALVHTPSMRLSRRSHRRCGGRRDCRPSLLVLLEVGFFLSLTAALTPLRATIVSGNSGCGSRADGNFDGLVVLSQHVPGI
jgi:hypothetical protein